MGSSLLRIARPKQLQQMLVAVLDRPRVRVCAKFVECGQRRACIEQKRDLRRHDCEKWREIRLGQGTVTVFRLPLAAARCSGVALCMSSEPASWPASSRICARS